MTCYTCHNNDHLDDLPMYELIALDTHWRAAHAFDTALPGWLVLVPRRHVTTIADLTDAEAVDLGAWQVRLSRALQAVIGCVKTYVVQFAEKDGFSHVHFHVIPRMGDIPDERRGSGVFEYLGQPPEQSVTDKQKHELAYAFRAYLDRHPLMPTTANIVT